MEKYIVLQGIKELNISKGQVLLVDNNGVAHSSINEVITYPYINIHNKAYFEPFSEKFKKGSYVIYDNRVYVVNHYNAAKKTYHLDYINSQKTAYISVSEKHLKETFVYFFISSKGVVQSAILGKDQSADLWRESTNNKFETKEAAQNHKLSILGFKTDKK